MSSKCRTPKAFTTTTRPSGILKKSGPERARLTVKRNETRNPALNWRIYISTWLYQGKRKRERETICEKNSTSLFWYLIEIHEHASDVQLIRVREREKINLLFKCRTLSATLSRHVHQGWAGFAPGFTAIFPCAKYSAIRYHDDDASWRYFAIKAITLFARKNWRDARTCNPREHRLAVELSRYRKKQR